MALKRYRARINWWYYDDNDNSIESHLLVVVEAHSQTEALTVAHTEALSRVRPHTYKKFGGIKVMGADEIRGGAGDD
jgi:hypothetical protein